MTNSQNQEPSYLFRRLLSFLSNCETTHAGSFLTLTARKLLQCWFPYTFVYLLKVPCGTFHLIDPVLVLYCCITIEQQTQKLNIVLFIIHHSFSQKSGQGLTGSSAGLQSSCWPGLGSHLSHDWGRICQQTHGVVGRIYFLVSIRPRPVSCWVSAGTSESYPLCKAVHSMAAWVFKASSGGDIVAGRWLEFCVTYSCAHNHIHPITFVLFYGLE